MIFTKLTHLSLAGEISNSVEPVNYFSGRSLELNNLRRNLANYKKASIVGISGIGKTQLLRKFVQSNNYRLVWSFDCNRDFDAQYVGLAKHINQNIKDKNFVIDENYANVKQAVLDYLQPKKDWLLIYDNLKLGQNYLVKDIVELEANGSIIIASQDGSDLPYTIYLHPLSDIESLEIINKIIPDNENADYLNKIFKGYPLLISKGLMLLKNNSSCLGTNYNKTLAEKASSIKLYMDLLIKEVNPATKELLYKIAVINNQSFSKQFVEKIVTHKDELTKELNYLIELGLIAKIKNSEGDEIFEMHEAIKDQLIAIAGPNLIKNIVNDIMTKAIAVIPISTTDRYLTFVNDPTLLSNFEKLLVNAEFYEIKKNIVLSLREKLITFYVLQRNFIKCKEMKEWLSNYEISYWQLWLIGTEDKTNYASYLNYLSIYEEWANKNFNLSIDLKNQANNILSKIKDNQEHKFTLLIQLAQSYINIGNIETAYKNLILAKEYIKKDSEKNMLYFVNIKIFFHQNKFREALKEINNIIASNKNLSLDSSTIPVFLLKARILNSICNYKEAHDILNKILNVEKNNKHYSDAKVLILVELAKAFMGLNNINVAYINAKSAKNMFLKQNKDKGINIFISQDWILASALKVEADCLSAMGNYSQALTNYAQAEAIFYNVYRENMKNNPTTSSLYFNAANAACKLKNKFWFNRFKFQHLAKFGLDHPKSQEIQTMQCF